MCLVAYSASGISKPRFRAKANRATLSLRLLQRSAARLLPGSRGERRRGSITNGLPHPSSRTSTAPVLAHQQIYLFDYHGLSYPTVLCSHFLLISSLPSGTTEDEEGSLIHPVHDPGL
jgi:hypothetical protein